METQTASIDVYGLDDITFVLRSRVFSPLDAQSGHNFEYQSRVLGGSLVELHGDEHFERRRLMSALFRRVTLADYERGYLVPAMRTEIARSVGAGRQDLLLMSRRALMRLMARLVGIDGLETESARDRLEQLFVLIEPGARSKYYDNPPPIVQKAVEAQQQMVEEFVEPSWRRREERAASPGSAGENPAPDMLSLMLEHQDHYASGGRAMMNREITMFMVASIGSTSNSICGAVQDLEEWFRNHPGDRARRTDPSFLHAAYQESLRLHKSEIMLRKALEDVTLPSGSKVSAGQVVVMHRKQANREAAVGSSNVPPDAFDPYREVDGAPYALAFGEGAHTCLGRQMVLGEPHAPRDVEARQGLGVTMLMELYRADLAFVDGDPPQTAADTTRETWVSFPVVFGQS